MEEDLRGYGDESPALELTSGSENRVIRWSLPVTSEMQKTEQVCVENMTGCI